MVTLWCGLGGLRYYPEPGKTAVLDRFLDRCAGAGVASLRFYFGFVHFGEPTVFRLEQGQRPFAPDQKLATFELYPAPETDPFAELIAGAHARDMRVLGYTSPDFQGALQPNPHSPLGERLPQLFLADFANDHPEFWARDAEGRDALARDGSIRLSLRHPAVRRHLAATLTQLVEQKGLDGLELEWLCGPEVRNPYGQAAEGGYTSHVTRFVHQMGQALPAPVHLSTAVEDDSRRALAWSHDWAAWAADGLVDTLVLRHRGHDAGGIADRVRAARALVGPDVHLVSQLDCWRETGFRAAGDLVTAAAAARSTGADEIGIYRADAVEAYDLWPALAEIGAF
jgi:hypothetical protein